MFFYMNLLREGRREGGCPIFRTLMVTANMRYFKDFLGMIRDMDINNTVKLDYTCEVSSEEPSLTPKMARFCFNISRQIRQFNNIYFVDKYLNIINTHIHTLIKKITVTSKNLE